MAARKYISRIKNPLKLRHKLGLTQLEFWDVLGVSQSGGSRYEHGRSMPRSLEILFSIVYKGTEVPQSPGRG